MDNSRVTLVDHPMVQHKLSILRDKATSCKQFRELVRELALFEGYEATRDLPLADVDVETPICTARCKQVSGKKLAVVPILRAGLGMVDGVLDLIPAARVGHLGMYRNEETHEPVPYYDKMPEDIANRTVLVVDPMLATGGSIISAVTYLRRRASTPSSPPTTTCTSTRAPLTRDSSPRPTSFPASATPATASSGLNNSPVDCYFPVYAPERARPRTREASVGDREVEQYCRATERRRALAI